MSPARVQLTAAAVRDLDATEATVRQRLVTDMTALGLAPVGEPPRVKRLRGFSFPLFRLRSGDHRVLYRVDGDLVTVLRVIDRRDLERSLRGLRRR